MSATYFGNEVKYTKRYQLGQQLSQCLSAFSVDDGNAT